MNSKYMVGDVLADLGFDSFSDFITTLTGFKNNLLAPFAFLTGVTISFFIKQNIWANPTEIYFLAILTGIDLFTGIWKSIVHSDDPQLRFKSRRISRTVGKIITYGLMLFMSFNLDKNMHLAFFWMPYACLCIFYTTEAWSIIENLSEVGYLDKSVVKILKAKLNLVSYFKKDINSKPDETPADKKKKSVK